MHTLLIFQFQKANRQLARSKNTTQVTKIQRQLINTLLKHSAVNKVLSERTKNNLGTTTSEITSKTKRKDADDIFKLPPMEIETENTSSDEEEDLGIYSEDESTTDSSPTKNWNIYNFDMNSKEFRSLPADVRYEILQDLKEQRKQSSWNRIHEMPKHSDDFSTYQMERLLKRQAVQVIIIYYVITLLRLYVIIIYYVDLF